MRNFTLLFLLLVSLTSTSQEWTVNVIGTCPKDKAYDIVVADGRNDGINRIYVTTRGETNDASIYEFTWNGSSWTFSTIEGSLTNLVSIHIGPGRNDGVNRLYAAEWHGTNRRIYEYSWTGSSWNKLLVDNQAGGMLGVRVADGRGDGIKRLYINGWIVQAEYTWNGSGWTKTDISTTHGAEGPMCIGNGKNDGIVRYYTPGNYVREFTWGGSSWNDNGAVSAASGWPETSEIADGRNDGINRIFTQDVNGTWEYTWSGSAWTGKYMSGRFGRSYLVSGKPKSDGNTYIYSTDIDSSFREYKWNESLQEYDINSIDAATGATGIVSIGIGRNDDTVRVYTPYYLTGQIYEITNISPNVLNSTGIKTEIQAEKSYCCYKNGSIFIEGVIAGSTINVYNSSGKLMSKKVSSSDPDHIAVTNFSYGVYYIQFRSAMGLHSEKVVISE